jgi:hypothetical protein
MPVDTISHSGLRACAAQPAIVSDSARAADLILLLQQRENTRRQRERPGWQNCSPPNIHQHGNRSSYGWHAFKDSDMRLKTCCYYLLSILFTVVALTQPVMGQASDELTKLSGVAVSSSPNTLVVKADSGEYRVFVFDRLTSKPKTIPNGSAVTVISMPSTESGVQLATDVIITKMPATGQSGAPPEPIPLASRRLEDEIKRQARKFGVGVRGGVGLDQEVLIVGVHARFGPFFNRDFSFRPNVEFGWGEVTKLFSINPEGVYRLPFTPRLGRWSAYVGLGPALGFVHRNFENTNIDFGELKFNAGLNVLTGVEFRSGMFFEMKSTIYASPHLRFIAGYTF